MGESRDSNDPRDAMGAMRKEAQAEFEREEARATGGQEHASREEREGLPASRREAGAGAGAGEEAISRSTREQSDAEMPRKPHGDPVTGGGGNAAGGAPAASGEPREE
jgi:hypothetical protein